MGLLDFMNNPEMIAAMKQFQPSDDDRRSALSQGLLSAGLGMLANNTGHYGAFAPALGAGGMQGMQSYQSSLDNAQKQKVQGLTGLHTQLQLANEIESQPLKLAQLKGAVDLQTRQQEVAAKFPAMIESLRGTSTQQAQPVAYQDQVTPAMMGSSELPSLQAPPDSKYKSFSGSPDQFFSLAAKISDPLEKRAAMEAGFRQWPELRPKMASPQQSVTNRDPATSLGSMAAMIGLSGMKGGDELMKFAGMLQPRELKGGTTYENPLTGQREYLPSYDKNQMPDGKGGVQAIPGAMDFLRQETLAKVDPVARNKAIFDTGMDPLGSGSPVQSNGGMTPAASNAVRQKEAESVASKTGELLDASKAAASGASNSINSINQIRQALGNAYAGPFASKRMSIAQLGESLNIGGADAREKLVNTRSLINGLANMSLDAAAKLKGSGSITDAERALLTKAASGDINDMTIPEMKLLMDITERQAVRLHSNHNDLVSRAKGQNINTWAYEVNPLPATPLPKNAKASDLQKGRVYATQKGDLVWNGMAFEDKK